MNERQRHALAHPINAAAGPAAERTKAACTKVSRHARSGLLLLTILAVAVRLLCGVGGEREWWIWNRQARVGHLRVAVTAAENAQIPAGVATDDAGESGPQRPRTR